MRPGTRRVAAVVLVGVAAGLVAAGVRAVLEVLGRVRTALVGGSLGGLQALSWPTAAWLVVLIALGLVGARLVARAARSVRESGLDGVIHRINRSSDGPHLGASGAVGVAGLIALGLGVSGGPEGPLAMLVQEAVAWIRRLVDLACEEELWLLDVGVGVGLGLVFGAPLAAVVFPIELVLRRGLAGAVLLASMIAAGIGWGVMLLLGFGAPLLGRTPHLTVPLGAYAAAVALAGLAVLLGAGYRWCVAWGTRLGAQGGPRGWALVVVTLVLTVAAGVALPALLATGAAGLPALVRQGLSIAPWLLVALLLGRAVLTGASLAAGAPVGLLGPTLIVGLSGGLLVARAVVATGLESAVGGPLVLGVVVMVTIFGAIGNMPLAMMLVGVEAVGRLAVVGPLVIAMAIAWFLAQHFGITLLPGQVVGEASWLTAASAPWPRARWADRTTVDRSAGSPTAIQPWPLPPPP